MPCTVRPPSTTTSPRNSACSDTLNRRVLTLAASWMCEDEMLERSSSAAEISSGLSGLTDCKAEAETTPFSTRRTSSLSALTLPDYTNQQNHNTITHMPKTRIVIY